MDGNQLIGYRTNYGACAEILIFVVCANVFKVLGVFDKATHFEG